MDSSNKNLLKELINEQKHTNELLTELLNKIEIFFDKYSSMTNKQDMGTELNIFDPELLLKFNKRKQKIILILGKYFAKGKEKLIVEEAQDLLDLSYPQTAAYLNELEQDGIIKAHRGDKDKGENPLKKYYYMK